MNDSNRAVSGGTYGAGPGGLTRRGFLRGIAGAGALLAGGGVLAACGTPKGKTAPTLARSAVATSAKGEITIWDRSGDLFKVIDTVIPKFNQVYPNITVHHQSVDIDTKLPNALITGAGLPDGSFWDDAKIPAQHEHLTDLSELIAPYRADIVPYKLDVNTVDGKIYGVPWDLDPGFLFYREDILGRAGIDPESITTYDKLLDAARQVKAKVNANAKPIHMDMDPFLSQLWLEMLANQLGTSMASADGTLRLDSPAYRQIFSWIHTAAKENLVGHSEYLGPTHVAELDNGTEVFVPWAIWFDAAPQQLLKTSKGKWRAMLLPAWSEGGARSGVMGGSSFLIPAGAKNAELAWKFYEFLVFNKVGYTTMYGPNSIYPGGLNTSVPSYKPALDPAKPLFRQFPEMGNQDLWSLAIEASKQIPRGAPLPSWWADADKYLGGGVLQKLMTADISPDDAIAQASAQIQKNLVQR